MKDAFTISPKQLVSFTASLTKGYPNPEDPDSPDGPWGPVIRRALRNTVLLTGTGNIALRMMIGQPELWNLWDGPLALAALNPQPLPPRIVFATSLAHEIIDRSLLIYDVAEAIQSNGTQQGSSAVGKYITRFTDELCPDPPKIRIPKGPWPPDPEPDPRWSAAELTMVALTFDQVAATVSKDIQKTFNLASEKLMETAMTRI